MENATMEQAMAVGEEITSENEMTDDKTWDRAEIPGGWKPGDEPMPQGVSQLSLDIGGELPTQSVLKFTGSLDLPGYELKKGTIHRFEVEVRVDGEGAKDSYDKHGNLKATVKEQSGTILGGQRV
jgi:hypothetical protein